MSTIVLMKRMKAPFEGLRYKVTINPSYDWSQAAQSLGISHRELEVFSLVVEGFDYKEIAEILHINHQSVKNHMQHFTTKLNVKQNAQALVIALYLKLISMEGQIGELKGEMTGEGIVKQLRDLIDGKAWVEGFNDKTKRNLKVFLLSHGIDLDSDRGGANDYQI